MESQTSLLMQKGGDDSSVCQQRCQVPGGLCPLPCALWHSLARPQGTSLTLIQQKLGSDFQFPAVTELVLGYMNELSEQDQYGAGVCDLSDFFERL